MLLDKYVVTKGLTSLLSHSPSASSSTTAQTGYTKRVNQSMGRLDPLLKTLQVRTSPPEALVQAYLIHIGDRSDTNFRKILDLKGVRKQDQASLVELFGIHRDGKSNEQLVLLSPLLTPLMNPSGMGSGGLGIGGVALGTATTVQQRFDPSGFGEKLFNTARDGVERAAVGAIGDRIGSPLSDDAKSAVEGNLKSIGKFFRRDMSGFSGIGGRFGGRRDVSGGAGGADADK
jgi:hypothetical protein